MLQTLSRAGDVLDLFTVDEPEWGVTATAQRLGIGKSLAHESLTSLAAIGLLQRVGHGRYRLGWRNLSLAAVLLRTSELSALSRPVVRELAHRTGVDVSLVAWDRGSLVCILRQRTTCDGWARGPAAGTTVPLDDSAAARVLLASRSAAEIEALWRGGLIQTSHPSLGELQADLQEVRRDGWASDLGPEAAHAEVAAPVRDAGGEVAAALSVGLAGLDGASAASVDGRIALAAAARITHAMRRAVALPYAAAG